MSAITDLFAGVPESDLDAGIDWYTRFFGRPPDRRVGDEVLWEIDEHAWLFIEPNLAQSDAGRITFAVSGLDALLERLAAQRIDHEPIETYSNGVRHVNIPDPDGNAIGAPSRPTARARILGRSEPGRSSSAATSDCAGASADASAASPRDPRSDGAIRATLGTALERESARKFPDGRVRFHVGAERMDMQEESTMDRIVIATDGSPAAQHALEVGVELAKHEQATVAIVPESEPVSRNGFGLVGHVRYKPTSTDLAVLEDAVAIAESQEVPTISKLLYGDVVAGIIDCADGLEVDLIVVGSRGHGAIASALLGSVSRGVLAHSKRPVLIVRAVPAAARVLQ